MTLFDKDAAPLAYFDPAPDFCQNCGDDNDQAGESRYCGSCEASYWRDIVLKQDKVTAIFTVVSSFMIFLNIHAAWVAKSVAGVSPIALLFVCCQAAWYFFFFRSNGNRLSMWCMIAAFTADVIYLGMWFRYGH